MLLDAIDLIRGVRTGIVACSLEADDLPLATDNSHRLFMVPATLNVLDRAFIKLIISSWSSSLNIRRTKLESDPNNYKQTRKSSVHLPALADFKGQRLAELKTDKFAAVWPSQVTPETQKTFANGKYIEKLAKSAKEVKCRFSGLTSS